MNNGNQFLENDFNWDEIDTHSAIEQAHHTRKQLEILFSGKEQVMRPNTLSILERYFFDFIQSEFQFVQHVLYTNFANTQEIQLLHRQILNLLPHFFATRISGEHTDYSVNQLRTQLLYEILVRLYRIPHLTSTEIQNELSGILLAMRVRITERGRVKKTIAPKAE